MVPSVRPDSIGVGRALRRYGLLAAGSSLLVSCVLMSDFDGLSGAGASVDAGFDGATGGEAGSGGSGGSSGAAGVAGTSGSSGSSGTAGVAGASGSSGAAGVAGASGSSGAGGGPVGSPKKGVGTWSFPQVNAALDDVNVAWYLTWKIDRSGTVPPAGVEFVPVVWSDEFATPSYLAVAKDLGTALIGFQSPDSADGANMTVAEALAVWPDMEATGMRLGSPVSAQNPLVNNSWLEQFLTGATNQGLRVDFVCVRWYGSDFHTPTAIDQLEGFLQSVHAKFGLPIWLTEFSLWTMSNGSYVFPSWSEQVAFVEASTALLDSLDIVERYAWFSLPKFLDPSDTTETSNLYNSDGTPTETGIAYRAAGTSP